MFKLKFKAKKSQKSMKNIMSDKEDQRDTNIHWSIDYALYRNIRISENMLDVSAIP